MSTMAVEEPATSEPASPRTDTRFTPETARKAASASAEARRAKAAARTQQAELDRLTVRQRLAHELNEQRSQIPAILQALVDKAKKGDVPAARELRGWYDQGLGRPEQAGASVGALDESTPYKDRTPEERALLRGVLMQKMIDAEAALEGDVSASEGLPGPPASPTPAS